MQYACFSYDTYNMLVLTHGRTRLPEIPLKSLCFQWIPSDYFPTLLLSKNLKILFTIRFHVMTRLPITQVDSINCASDLISRLDSIRLQVLSTGIWLRVLDMCGEEGSVGTPQSGGQSWTPRDLKYIRF